MNLTYLKPSAALKIRNRPELTALLLRAARECGLADAETVLVVFAGPLTMARLNALFLGHRGSTDVLSFNLRAASLGAIPGDGEEPTPTVEIYVCPQVAVRAARQYGTTPAAELLLYVVHGLLHAAGYDDLNPAAKRRMRRAERRVLCRLNADSQLKKLLTFN